MPQLSERTRPRKPGRWGWKLKAWQVERIWRDLIPLVALLIAFYAVLGIEGKQDRQREGRRVAVDVLCGGTRGVEDAGSLILTDRLPGTEGLGRPRSARERAVGRAYARAYAKVISAAIIKQAGVDARKVLQPNGTLDCEALKTAARTQPGS